MNFNYEIRLVEKGHCITVPDEENTVSYAVWYDGFTEHRGTKRPVWSPMGWLINAVSIVSPNEEETAALAEEGLESLPNLSHKFVLVYKGREKRIFEDCFLVATDDQHWWEEYEVLEQ